MSRCRAVGEPALAGPHSEVHTLTSGQRSSWSSPLDGSSSLACRSRRDHPSAASREPLIAASASASCPARPSRGPIRPRSIRPRRRMTRRPSRPTRRLRVCSTRRSPFDSAADPDCRPSPESAGSPNQSAQHSRPPAPAAPTSAPAGAAGLSRRVAAALRMRTFSAASHGPLIPNPHDALNIPPAERLSSCLQRKVALCARP